MERLCVLEISPGGHVIPELLVRNEITRLVGIFGRLFDEIAGLGEFARHARAPLGSLWSQPWILAVQRTQRNQRDDVAQRERASEQGGMAQKLDLILRKRFDKGVLQTFV